MAATFCDRCGTTLTTSDAGSASGGAPAGGNHGACEAARRLEPPRFCRVCRRRMVVQVTPTGWTARCSEHGLRTG